MAFSRKQIVAMYGSEYPEAVDLDGVRLPLTREGRFLRSYDNKDAKVGTVVSRFMDGTAEISLTELKASWPRWSRMERYDFTSGACWLHDHPEFADMMRFVMEEGDQDDLNAVSLQVATALPTDEAFERLYPILQRTPIGKCANIGQAIAHTKHADAPDTLRELLRKTLRDPRLMEPDDFLNWVTYDAICCIEHLLELGLSHSEFEDVVRRLCSHPSDGTIDSLRRRLAKWYPWLGEPEPPKTKL